MKNTIVHIIDFEGNLNSGVIEFGIVSIMNNEIIGFYTNFCTPLENPNLIPTRFKRNFFIDSFPFIYYWKFFLKLRQTGILASHMSNVEDNLLKKTWPLIQESPNWFNNEYIASWGPWIDTCKLYRFHYPNIKNYSLLNLIKQFNLQSILYKFSLYCPFFRRKKHCALYDAFASAILFMKLQKIYNKIESDSTKQKIAFLNLSGNKQYK